MNRIPNIFLFIILSQRLLWSESVGTDKELVHPVSMEVFDGEGSLLLHWTFADTIKAKEIRIYKRNSQNENFDLISTLDFNSDRYLDNKCKPLDRYFYFIEVIDEKMESCNHLCIIDSKCSIFNEIGNIYNVLNNNTNNITQILMYAELNTNLFIHITTYHFI